MSLSQELLYFLASMKSKLPSRLNDLDWLKKLAKSFQPHTAGLYEGVPLYHCSNRGLILQHYVRDFYDKLSYKTQDAPLIYRTGVSSCDFITSTGERIEVKSSILSFDSTYNRYKLGFQNVKHGLHDKLLLVSYFPDSLILWEWDSVNFGR